MHKPTSLLPWLSLSAVPLALAKAPLDVPGLFSGLATQYCPESCRSLGSDPANWTQIHREKDLRVCEGTLLFDLNVMNSIKDPENSNPTLRICSTGGEQTFDRPDESSNSSAPKLRRDGEDASNTPLLVDDHCGAKAITVKLPMSVDSASFNSSLTSDVKNATEQLALYLEGGAPCGNTIMFAKSGAAVVGLYAGSEVEKHSAAGLARSFAQQVGSSSATSLQVCNAEDPGTKSFGIFSAPLEQLVDAQSAVKAWSKGRCLNGTTTTTALADADVSVLVAMLGNGTASGQNSTNSSNSTLAGRIVAPRATCRYIQVVSGDSCASLESKCGVTDAQFMSYNTKSNLCSTLQVRQPVCCSSGDLPNLAPQPSNGNCATHTIVANDDCYDIAFNNYITQDDLYTFNNNKTWGWSGCSGIQPGQLICLSTGNPPLPAPVPKTQCGPTVPGTVAPTNGTKIADLNPCPLNACCDSWGFCGTTSDFCTIALADTGAPGTHQPGTNGCVSNCGTDIVNNGSPPSSYSRIAYFEAFNQQRPCLTMDASQIDTTKFTHVHFAFGGVSGSYQVTIDSNSTDQFTAFTKISGPKKILSIGGWAFSTDPDTYSYFRTGVTAGNRQTFANNVASFVNSNGLDGVDFDWEYAGEPDIAGIPAGSADDGPNYLAFLKLVRAALGTSKSISVALPASFWYLRAFPVKDLQNVVDYFVYMTYDLHGQWDYGNANADTGCSNGNCLRSHVNLTETTNALSMLTKAGVSSTKIMVGISNYGRSFRMSDSSCSGPMCTYTGGYDQSNATPGICTGTSGYIADGEIYDIISGGSDDWPVFQSYYDYDSNSDILIYGQDSSTADWVAYESPTTQNSRIDWAKGLNMAGTVTWAVDLEDWYDDPNAADEGWADLQDLDTTCDPSKMPNSLDDLANAQGALEPPCWSRYAILLLESALESTISDYQAAANGYDDKFGYYVGWVKDSIDPQLQDYMKFMGKGQSFFDCDYSYGGQKGSSSCWGMPRFWDDDYSYTITFKLHDEDGFFNAIEADLGLDKSWVKFGDYTAPYSCASDGSDDRPGGGSRPCRRLTHKYSGFPMKADNVQVANPKDIIQAAMPNITSLQNIMLGAGVNMALGLYNNDTEDAVQASALPVFMLQDAVDSMKNIKDIGAKVADEKKKSLILEILSIVLIVIPFVGEAVGAIFGGAAMIARIALIIGEVGNAALSIESIVADPLSAPFAILGLLAGGLGGGVGRAGKIEEDLFAEAAAARRAMKADDIGKFSQAFQKKDATVEQIVKACKRR